MGPKNPPPFFPVSKSPYELGSAPKAVPSGKSRSGGQRFNANGSQMTRSKNLLDLNKLVRSVQRSEGEEACFKIGRFDCDDAGCRWRIYCLDQEQPGKK